MVVNWGKYMHQKNITISYFVIGNDFGFGLFFFYILFGYLN